MPSLQVAQLNLRIVLIKIIKISILQKKNVRTKIHPLFFPRRHLTRSRWAGEFSFISKMFQTKQKTQTFPENTVNCLATICVEYSLLGTFSLYQSGSAAFYNGRNSSHNKIVFLVTDSECTDHNVRHDLRRLFYHKRLAGTKAFHHEFSLTHKESKRITLPIGNVRSVNTFYRKFSSIRDRRT